MPLFKVGGIVIDISENIDFVQIPHIPKVQKIKAYKHSERQKYKNTNIEMY